MSQDPPAWVSDPHVPVRREDVSDPALLPQHFRMLANEMRGEIKSLGDAICDKVLPRFDRIELAIGDMGKRLELLERAAIGHDRRIAALESHRSRPRPKAKRKR